ncbi:hypothetical protein ACNKHL_10655 [Shigella flexneri]
MKTKRDPLDDRRVAVSYFAQQLGTPYPISDKRIAGDGADERLTLLFADKKKKTR